MVFNISVVELGYEDNSAVRTIVCSQILVPFDRNCLNIIQELME